MRGFDTDDVREVGRIMCEALSDEADLAGLTARSAGLCERRPLYAVLPAFPTSAHEGA